MCVCVWVCVCMYIYIYIYIYICCVFVGLDNKICLFLHFYFNPLNAELNPICHLLVLLGDLTFMGTYIVSIFQYTGCPGGNVPNFGRMFLRLKYTHITQNTYIRSRTVTERMTREKCGLLAVSRTAPVSRDV